MNKLTELLKSTKGKDYTLNDIFVKNNEIVFSIPLFLFMLTPAAELLLFGYYITEHPVAYDFTYPAIIYMTDIICLLITAAAVISFFAGYGVKSFGAYVKSAPAVCAFAPMMLIAVASTVVNGTFNGNVLYFLSVFSYFFVYYFCASFISSENIKKNIITVFLSLHIFLGITVLIDEFIFPIPAYIFYYTSSVFEAANYYGYFILIAMILSAAVFEFYESRKMKILSFISFALGCVLLTMTTTFGCFLAAVIALIFLFVEARIRNGRFSFSPLVMLAVMLVISYLVGLRYGSFFSDIISMFGGISDIAENNEAASEAGTGRWGIWLATVELIKQKPLLGWGCSGFWLPLFDKVGINAAHNEYLADAAEFGIPAALTYIAGLLLIFYRIIKNIRNSGKASAACAAAAFAYIVSSFFGNRINFVAPFFFIFLGLANELPGNIRTENK